MATIYGELRRDVRPLQAAKGDAAAAVRVLTTDPTATQPALRL